MNVQDTLHTETIRLHNESASREPKYLAAVAGLNALYCSLHDNYRREGIPDDVMRGALELIEGAVRRVLAVSSS